MASAKITLRLHPVKTVDPSWVGYLMGKNPANVYEKTDGLVTVKAAWDLQLGVGGNFIGLNVSFESDPAAFADAVGGETLGDYVSDGPWVMGPIQWLAFHRAFRSAFVPTNPDKLPEHVRKITETTWDYWLTVLPMRLPDAAERIWQGMPWPGEDGEPREPAMKTSLRRGPGRDRALDLGVLVARGQGVFIHDLFRRLVVGGLACDGRRHHLVGDADREKLLRLGDGWLNEHPERDLIVKHFLGDKRQAALAIDDLNAGADGGRPADVDATPEPEPETESETEPEPKTETPEPEPEAEAPSARQMRQDEILKALGDLQADRPGKPLVVVEIGCGDGMLLERMHAAGYAVIGMEPNARALRLARFWLRRKKLPIRVHSFALLSGRTLPPLTFFERPIRQGHRLRGLDAGISAADQAGDAPRAERLREHRAVLYATLTEAQRAQFDAGEDPTERILDVATRPTDAHVLPDVVVASEVFEHMEYEDVVHALDQIRPGSRAEPGHRIALVATLPNGAYRPADASNTSIERVRHPDHRWEPAGPDSIPLVGCWRPRVIANGISFLFEAPRYWVSEEHLPEPPQTPLTIPDGWLHTRNGRPTVMPTEAQRVLARSLIYTENPVSSRMVPWIPPNMGAVDAAQTGPELERIEDAIAYYRERLPEGSRLVIQEKHMGSRAVFYARRTTAGIQWNLYSRTGRPFDRHVWAGVCENVVTALRRSSWFSQPWAWILLDGEAVPWGVKAAGLIDRDFMPAGVALNFAQDSREDIDDATAFLSVLEQFDARDKPVGWAPFGVLGGSAVPDAVVESNLLQMETLNRLREMAPGAKGLLRPTQFVEIDPWNPDHKKLAREFFEALVLDLDQEGVVVKPLSTTQRNKDGTLAQPGLKVRGADYLRIIYGPTYQRNLDRFRKRQTGFKRAVALHQHALGLRCLEILRSMGASAWNPANLIAVYRDEALALGLSRQDPRL